MSYFKLLRARLPGETLINYGRFNDTTAALYRRIYRHQLVVPVDMSFVWVGVNDVLVRHAFRAQYRALLDLLMPFAGTLVAVSPALIGEDAGSASNAALADLGAIIGDLAAGYPTVTFLDLHAQYIAALRRYPPVSYRPMHPLQSVIDTLKLCSPEAVDRVAAARGFRLTLDGVHLNSMGAILAADAFQRAIDGSLRPLRLPSPPANAPFARRRVPEE